MSLLTERTEDESGDPGIALIAAFKVIKALLLIALGLGAIGVAHAGVSQFAQRVISMVSSGTERRVAESMLSRISGMSPRRIEALGIGAFLYAALFLIEGVGLWRRKRWAEYLTVIATASFIPFEIYELVHARTVPRIAALLINIAVVIYLIFRLRRPRRVE